MLPPLCDTMEPLFDQVETSAAVKPYAVAPKRPLDLAGHQETLCQIIRTRHQALQ